MTPDEARARLAATYPHLHVVPFEDSSMQLLGATMPPNYNAQLTPIEEAVGYAILGALVLGALAAARAAFRWARR